MLPIRPVAVFMMLALLTGCAAGDRGGDAQIGVTTAHEPTAVPTGMGPDRVSPTHADKTLVSPTPTPAFTPMLKALEPAPRPASTPASKLGQTVATPASVPTPTHPPASPAPDKPGAKMANAPSTPTPSPIAALPIPTPGPTEDIALLVARGKRLVERNNCLGYHTTQGESNSAPTFKGLYGTVRELEGGATVSADSGYLRESIKRPNEKIVLGYFPDAMPTVFFNEAEINAMVEHIKTLK